MFKVRPRWPRVIESHNREEKLVTCLFKNWVVMWGKTTNYKKLCWSCRLKTIRGQIAAQIQSGGDMWRPSLDRVPVSEWLLGSFVLILYGVDEYFSCINCHISKGEETFGLRRPRCQGGSCAWARTRARTKMWRERKREILEWSRDQV